MPRLEVNCRKAKSFDRKHSWSFQKSRYQKRRKTASKKRCGLVPSLLSQKVPATFFRQYPSITFVCPIISFEPVSLVDFVETFMADLSNIEHTHWIEYDFFQETGYSFQQLRQLPVSSEEQYNCISPTYAPTSPSLSPGMETKVKEVYNFSNLTSYLSVCIQEKPVLHCGIPRSRVYAMLDVNSFLHLAFASICQSIPSFLYDITALVIDYINIFATNSLQHQPKKLYDKLEPSISWWFCGSSDCFACDSDVDWESS